MANDPVAYTCPACGFRSYNPNDLANRYCVRCHRFQDENDHSEAFQCIECRRHIVRMVPMPELGHLCGSCIHMPGWYRDPELREIWDPDTPVPDDEEP